MQYSLHDVFISYRRFEDKEKNNDLGTRLAGAVYRFLTKKGLRVFWDDPEMEPGDFEEQLYWQIEHSPNYIFIGTEAAKRFRPDVKDFVAEEVGLALKLYHASPNKDRVAIHVLPMMSDMDREKAAEAGPYPDEIQKLMKLHGVELHDELPTDKDLSDILKHVTRVNRGNMWNAGHHWFEQSRKVGHRFASLNINKSIMPNANIQRQEDVRLPIRAHGDGQADLPLLEMIEKTPGHLYLIGEGGIGKTTALYSIMEDVYGGDLPTGSMEQLRLNGQVPLFVELSRAPDTYGKLYEGGKSTFIHRAVYQQLRQDLSAKQVPGSAVRRLDEVFEIDPETAVNPIHDLFTQQSPAPEYLLLLDGLNEVSRVVIEHKEEPEMKSAVVTMILQEIHQLMTECPNVRVILTSRSKEQTNWGDETTLLYLSGVNDDSVKDYLAKANVSQARIESAMNNEKLRDVLRVPLFLTLYAALDGDEELLTQGEILHLFFHQKKKALYSTRTRIDQVDEDVDKAASAKQFHRLTATMQGFIVDFILPEIAWRMEQNDMFHIYRIGDEDEVNLSSIIEHVLTDESDTAVCGRYAEAFEEYLTDSDAAQDTLAIAEDMIERLGGRMRRVVDNVLNCAVMTLGILEKNGDEYGFIHHHIRDYFAAVYQINRLKLAVYLQKRKKNELARECLSDWKAAPLHAEVRRFIGEALGEAHNAPVCDDEGNWHYVVPGEPCERNIIRRVLDIYRGRFEGEDGYAVWNCIEILKDVRIDLCGADFSDLDLIDCRLGITPVGRKGCSVRLDGSKVNANLFIYRGHTRRIISASYSPDGSLLATTSMDGSIKIWDARSLQEKKELKGYGCYYKSHGYRDDYFRMFVAYSPDGKHVITSDTDLEYIDVLDAKTLKKINTLGDYKSHYTCYSPDGRYIVCVHSYSVDLWDAKTFKSIGELKGIKKDSSIRSVRISADSNFIAVSFYSEKARIWDARTLKETGSIQELGKSIRIAGFSPDGKSIIAIADDCSVSIWNMFAQRKISVLKGHNKRICCASYSPDGKLIVTASDDCTLKVWSAQSFQEIVTISTFKEPVTHIMFSPDGRYFATTSDECFVRFFDTYLFCETGKTEGYSQESIEMCSSPKGNQWANLCEGSVDIWDKDTVRKVGSLRVSNNINNVIYSASGKYLATITDHEVVLWNAITLQRIGDIKIPSTTACTAAFPPDDKKLILALDSTLIQWDIELWREIKRVNCDLCNFTLVGVTSDSKTVVIHDKKNDGMISLWDIENMVKLRNICEIKDEWNCTWLALLTSNDNLFIFEKKQSNHQYMIYNLRTGDVYRDTMYAHSIYSVCCSIDGERVAISSLEPEQDIWTCRWDERVIVDILDMRTGKRCTSFETEPENMIYSMAFGPADEHMIIGCEDGTIKIWNVQKAECSHSINLYPGLDIVGVDLRHLHPDSHLSDEVKELLYEYGAIVDERG